MTTIAQRRDKAVDALGATAHALSWLLLVVEGMLTAAAALVGVAVAARGAPAGWALTTAAGVRLAGLACLRWRPLSYRGVLLW